jgi:hypothetical protein
MLTTYTLFVQNKVNLLCSVAQFYNSDEPRTAAAMAHLSATQNPGTAGCDNCVLREGLGLLQCNHHFVLRGRLSGTYGPASLKVLRDLDVFYIQGGYILAQSLSFIYFFLVVYSLYIEMTNQMAPNQLAAWQQPAEQLPFFGAAHAPGSPNHGIDKLPCKS